MYTLKILKNVLLKHKHGYGYNAICICSCLFNVEDCVKYFSQYTQEYSFSAAWIRSWFFKFDGSEKMKWEDTIMYPMNILKMIY